MERIISRELSGIYTWLHALGNMSESTLQNLCGGHTKNAAAHL